MMSNRFLLGSRYRGNSAATKLSRLLLVLPALLLAGGALAAATADLQAEVMRTERAFAKTMADRDHEAFRGFLADEAIFFDGSKALRGKAAVAEAWAPLFEGPDPPFSWDPDQVEVLDSGTLALSTGPVYDPRGNVTGRFQSIWRRDADGAWQVVFDRGSPVCRPCGGDDE